MTPSTPAYHEFRSSIEGIAPERIDQIIQATEILLSLIWIREPFIRSGRSFHAYEPLRNQIIELNQLLLMVGL